MKTIFALYSIIFILLISCKKSNEMSKPRPIDTTQVNSVTNSETKKIIVNSDDWQEGFGLTHKIDVDSIWYKPVRYYIENKDCDPTAINFYYGKYRPTDELKTAKLLALIETENNELRPFYRWILNKTIQIQDGALGEYTGVPARKYAEKYPNEFFEYMDIDSTGQKYSLWHNSILYSGFYDLEDSKNSAKIRLSLISKMTKNCTNCNSELIKRIDQFALDCFPK